ncbi:MAG: GGDEF domain-containing protein [Treponema sp.]|jgi:diguanylate cyclase (GGDEF)-like protein|nr:GGDEF domain-containing protein [Treponema sp.]
MSDNTENQVSFLSSPQIIEHYSFLQELGVFRHIDSLNREIRGYKNLLLGALHIFTRTSIDEIMDAAVEQISDLFLPSLVIFLWKPVQHKEGLTIKGYQNYKVIDPGIKIESIAPFEPFFRQYPKPVNYEYLLGQMKDNASLDALVGIRPELIVPILGPSGLYGLILIGPKLLTGGYTRTELEFLNHLMSFASQAIQNHLHYEQTLRDGKTGLFNYSFFMTRIAEEAARIRRGDYSSSIIVIDVDHFKQFNDSFGHLMGDRVLENIALVIKQGVRTEDIPSRFGGEEFTILLPHADRGTVWAVAERLRIAVANMKVPTALALPPVTISLGVFTFDKYMELNVAEIINRADMALYQSKEQGRNRTTVWGSGLLFKIQNSGRGIAKHNSGVIP